MVLVSEQHANILRGPKSAKLESKTHPGILLDRFWRHLGGVVGHLGRILGHLGGILGHPGGLGSIWGTMLGPSWLLGPQNYPKMRPCWDQVASELDKNSMNVGKLKICTALRPEHDFREDVPKPEKRMLRKPYFLQGKTLFL